MSSQQSVTLAFIALLFGMLSSSNNSSGFRQPEAPPAATSAARTTAPSATMEDKLHGVAASFRRERDEAHRRQWTAKERLRLVQQEAQAMAATVESMEKDYKAMQQKMGSEQELQALMRDVDLLTKEVRASARGACMSVTVIAVVCVVVGAVSQWEAMNCLKLAHMSQKAGTYVLFRPCLI